ncbi:MAG: hypothetical protein RIR00_1374 [Pseudomonadota bacterium]
MKRSRSGNRERISRDSAELERLALGLSQSGGRLEDNFWEAALSHLVDQLLQHGGEDEINTTLDRLFEAQPRAHDELADMVEALSEACTLPGPSGEPYLIQLFACPFLAWSRFTIPTQALPEATVQTLAVQLGAHVFAADVKVALSDLLWSPDQLPQSFCDTASLTRELGQAALNGQHMRINTEGMPPTNRFLSDSRYVVGAFAVRPGQPLFRWNENDGNRESAQRAWVRQGGPLLEPLLTGCAFQPLLPDAYYAACRQSDRASRPYSIQASVSFLQTTLGLEPESLRAVVGTFHDKQLEEFRISFGPRQSEGIYHGVVWPLLGNEDENADILGEIDTALRAAGIKDIVQLDHRFPMEFCDDCGAPMYPDKEGELVHAEMPDQPEASPSLTLH